jgi:putative transposase
MCAHQRRPLFANQALVARMRLQLLRTADERRFEILAYTFMPDHLHLLVDGTAEECDLVGFAMIFRRRATSECPVSLRPLWQDGYHDQVLRDDDCCGE